MSNLKYFINILIFEKIYISHQLHQRSNMFQDLIKQMK